MAFATASDHEAATPGGRLALATPNRHLAELARARRHSLLVRAARLLLPGLIVVGAGLYLSDLIGLGRFAVVDTKRGRIEVGRLQTISRDGIGMANPRYQGFSKDGGSYDVTAARAITDFAAKGPLKLETIKGQMVQPDGAVTHLYATRGSMDTKSSILTLTDGIKIETDKQMSATLDVATVETKLGRITSDRPVLVSLPSGEVRANSMVVLQKTREVSFDNGVATRLVPKPPVSAPVDPNGAAGAAAPAKRATASAPFGGSDAPVDITSVRLVVKDADKTAEFLGNVKAVQGDATLTSSSLHVVYTGSQMPGETKTSGAGQGNIKSITARDGVVMTRGQERVTSPQAVFEVASGRAALTGGVTMTSGPERRVVSARADLDNKADTALLTGDVVVTQGPNELRGARMLVNRGAQTMEMTGSGQTARIHAKFVQPASDKAANPAKARAPAAANPLGAQFRPTPGAPITIEAVRLDVDDRQHTATFRGEVAAVQGDFRLNSAELVATYIGGAGSSAGGFGFGGGKAAPAAAKPAGGDSPARLKRIHARNKVVVRTGANRMATGDWADFDVAANTVTLGGKVVLTEGRQVVNGERLVIDLTTGLSQLKRSDGVPTTPGGVRPNPTTGDCGGRMCAVFYPKDVEEAQKRAAAEKRQGAGAVDRKREPTTSGWSTDTRPPSANR